MEVPAGTKWPYHALAVHEGLSPWIMVLKDLMKRIISALEEAELMVGSLRVLQTYPERVAGGRQRPQPDRNIMFESLSSGLAIQIARLRGLREDLRDDLVVIEMLLLDCSYRELMGDKGKGVHAALRPPIVLPEPEGESDLPRQYARALEVLWSTRMKSTVAEFKLLSAKEIGPALKDIVKAFGTLGGQGVITLLGLRDLALCQPAHVWREIERGLLNDDSEDRFDKWLRRQIQQAELKIRRSNGSDTGSPPAVVRRADGIGRSHRQKADQSGRRQGQKALDLLADLRQKKSGRVHRKNALQLVVKLAQKVWEKRRDGILRRVARHRLDPMPPERAGATEESIHDEFFGRVERYHHEFDEALRGLADVFAAFRQRSAVLPPNFPPVPRFHRREREAHEACILRLVDKLKVLTRGVARFIRDDEKELVVDVSFDYTYASTVRHHDITDDVRFVWIVVPMFFTESPRYLVNLAHEIAHSLFDVTDLRKLVHSDKEAFEKYVQPPPEEVGRRQGSWNRTAALAIRRAANKLNDLYIETGSPRERTLDEIGLITEVLADLVAVCVVGPHFLYSLMFTTLGLVGSRGGEEEEVVLMDYEVYIHPWVRITAMLQVAQRIWKIPLIEQNREPGAGWRSGRLMPLVGIWDAYFRILRRNARTRWQAERALRLIEEESDILAEMCLTILEPQKNGESAMVLARFVTKSAKKDRALHAWAERLALKRMKPTHTDLRKHLQTNIKGFFERQHKELKKWLVIDPSRLHRRSVTKGGRLGASVRSAGEVPTTITHPENGCSHVDEWMASANALHLIWHLVTKRYYEFALDIAHAIAHRADNLKDNLKAKVEAMLWTRVPEVRPLLALMDPASESEPATESESASESEPANGRASDTSTRVVSIIEVNSFWRSWKRVKSGTFVAQLDKLRGWLGERLPTESEAPASDAAQTSQLAGASNAALVLGTHDFQFILDRFDSGELMQRAIPNLHALLPEGLSDCFVRSLDYEVHRGDDHVGEGSEKPCLEAFIQVRLEPRDTADSCGDFKKGLDAQFERFGREPRRVWRSTPLYRSFAWDHFTFGAGFKRWSDLVEFLTVLEAPGHIQARCFNLLLHRQPRTHWRQALSRSAFARPTVWFVGLVKGALSPQGRASPASCFSLERAGEVRRDALRSVRLGAHVIPEGGDGRAVPDEPADGEADRLSAHLPWGVTLTVRPVLGLEDLELRVGFWVADEPKTRDAIVLGYLEILYALMKEVRAFDARTQLTFPEALQ
ncbi:MAG: hypothetical protein H6705_16950 [Myxococcales bacterium]|nr:hypothetical protein [Myxococcales bacterium]